MIASAMETHKRTDGRPVAGPATGLPSDKA